MADTMGGLAFQPIVPFQHLPRFRHEGPVLPEVGEGPSPRLQGGPPSWQGLRDLQVQPALQGPPALRLRAAQASRGGRRKAAFAVLGRRRRGPHAVRHRIRWFSKPSGASPCTACPAASCLPPSPPLPASPPPRTCRATPC